MYTWELSAPGKTPIERSQIILVTKFVVHLFMLFQPGFTAIWRENEATS